MASRKGWRYRFVAFRGRGRGATAGIFSLMSKMVGGWVKKGEWDVLSGSDAQGQVCWNVYFWGAFLEVGCTGE